MHSHTFPTEEQLFNFNGLASPMDPNCSVDTLSVSLQSCEPFSVTGSDSSNNLAVSHIPRADNLVGDSNSFVTTELDEQINDVGVDDIRHDDASEAIVTEIVQSSTQRSTCMNKIKKTENPKAARKSSRIADKRTRIDLLFLNVERRRRSGLCKRAQSSSWGSLKHITEVFKQNIGNDVNQNEHRESLKARTVQRGGKTNKDRRNKSSQTPKGEIPAITRCIRLKVKLGKKTITSCPSNMLPGTDKDLDNLGGIMTKSPELGMNIDIKSGEEEVVSSMQSESLNMNLNKDAVPLEVSILDVRLSDKVIKEKSVERTEEDLHGLPSQNGVQGPEETTEYRCVDPGTSPDSEVINVNPEAQVSGIVSEDPEYILISSKDVGHGDLISLIPSETSSEKGSPKDTLCQASKCSGERGLPGKEVINDCVLCYNYGQTEILGVGDIPYNGISNLTNPGVASSHASSSEGCHIEPLHSSPVTEVGGPAETSKVSGGEVSKCSKSKSTSKSKSEVSESVNKTRNNCGQKECEAKSSGGYKVKEKDVDEAVCKEQRCPETGIDEVDDVKYGGGSAIEGSSNLNMLPSEFRDQHSSLRNAWVCCDDCCKWRRIPALLADSIEATNCRWICKDNMEKAFADCSIPQEKSNADINAELEISDEEDNPDTRLSFNQIVQKQPTVPVQARWKLIKSNLFLHRNRKNQPIDEVMVCHCKPPLDDRKGCRDGCLNRMLNIECAKATCPCGELCSNQQFQKRKYAKLKCFRSGKKGFGLQVQEDIPKGRFLIEYVGEVLDVHAYEARQREYASKGHKHFYFMTLNGTEVIDACAKGNLGRFINHSCEPNCQTEKWMVNGEVCIGLFAVRDIKKGEEVTFDYNYVRVFGAAAKKCVCGSSQCRGYIGGDPQSTDIIVQGDSDDECPEPVMINEDAADKLDTLMSETNFFDGTEIQSPESPLKNNVEADKCMTAMGHLKITKENKPPEHLFEEKAVKFEPSSRLWDPMELLPSVEPVANLSQPIQHVEIPLQINEGKSKITSEYRNEYSGEEEDEKLSFCTTERNETSSLSSTVSNLSPATSKVKKKCKSMKDETARLTSKSHPRTKSSRPPSLVIGGKLKKNPVHLTKPQVENHSLAVPCKSKKLSQVPLDPRFEAVQQTLNELLDADGGISKRKDASRGYLKLLYQTAASGIQSNRDLSMILDALLKTKSRTVLADILNKNGLQMLHNIMKLYRKEFNKIPILRKLLKVLEYLAIRVILTLETINQGPPRPGVVSFKESILELTEHNDKQVHQIARSFRDRWIQRRRQNFVERDVDRMDRQRDSNFNRSSASRDSSSDWDGRPMEAIDKCAKQSPSTNTPPLDGGIAEGPTASCPSNCIIPSGTRTRKRKSRWDQPADTTSPSNKEPFSLSPRSHSRTHTENGEAVLDQLSCETKRICPTETQNTDEDAPPGFSSPLKGNLVHSNLSKITPDAVMGKPQERFISRMTVSYGVPISILQQLEIPQIVADESWGVAPAMPFQPFPPLPSHPRGPQPVNLHTQEQASSRFHSDRNQNCPTTCYARPQDVVIPFPNNQPSFQGGGGHSHNLGRKYFRQQKWNNQRNGRPWLQRNNGWDGFKGSVNSSNGPHGQYSSGVVSNGRLGSGTGFPHQPPHH